MKASAKLADVLRRKTEKSTFRLSLLIAVFTLIAGQFLVASSARPYEKAPSNASWSGRATSLFDSSSRPNVKLSAVDSPRSLSLPNLALSRVSFTPMVQTGGSETIDTYATDNQGSCTNTLKDQFTTGDIVCSKVANISSQPRNIYWVNPDDQVVQIDSVNANSPSGTRAVSQIGNWRAYLVDGTDGSARAVAAFSISDPQNPAADLSVANGADSSTFTAGGFIRITVQVSNNGPDTADQVELDETTPNNTTFVSVTQDSGQPIIFTCTPGNPTVCKTNGLAAGASASFTFVYQVDASAPIGTVIQNTATVSSQTTELNSGNNITNIGGTVIGVSTDTGTCSVACPDDITTPANTVDQNNNPGAIVHFSPPSGNDQCGTIVVNHCDDCFFPQGTTTVTATAATGQSCSFTVTVTAPNPSQVFITCPPNKDVNTTSSDTQCQTNVNVGTPTTAGGQNVTITSSRSDGQPLTDPYPVGTTTITWTATSHSSLPATDDNATGNASCQQTVTVHDKTAPVITCPANVTTGTDPGSCSATVDPGAATATDNCDSNPTVSGNRSDAQALNAPYPKGTTTITWTAIDSAGNLSSCTQTVTVNDTEKPVITSCPANITTSNDPGQCSATVNPGTATATDNCGTPTVTGTRSDNQALNAPYPNGTTTITWTATDASGNHSSCTQTVTVNDTERPTISCPANMTRPTDPNQCSAVVTFSATASDNCPGVTYSCNPPSGSTFPKGTTTVTCTATDTSGNSSAPCSFTVTVIDTQPPSITCPANKTVEPTCPAGAVVTYPAPVVSDNCPGVTFVCSPASGSTFPIGTTTVTCTATDTSGNTASCSFTVHVESPAEVIQDLINRVQALMDQGVLSQSNGNGLQNKLHAAQDDVNSGNTVKACNDLDSFIDKVQGYIQHGTLTSAQGQPLIDSAVHAEDGLGCKPVTCS